MWKAAAVAGAMATQVAGHGSMVWPPNWFDANGTVGLTQGGQCTGSPWDVERPGFCMWFTNNTVIPGQPTLPQSLHTYKTSPAGTPWKAPGSAPLASPCGVSGGNPKGCPVGGPAGKCQGGGFGYGPAAETVTFPDVVTTEWTAGGTAEVGWGIIANHGGGYSYRLCPAPAAGKVVTEECFQAHPLDFDGDTQWVQYGPNGDRVEFVANRTREGTVPTGSQWTKNPIPACAGSLGGYMNPLPECGLLGLQFPAPAKGLAGFGEDFTAPGKPQFMFTIMDRVQVPKLVPGEYVLSFRWDCEQTTQVWNTCASIRIK